VASGKREVASVAGEASEPGGAAKTFYLCLCVAVAFRCGCGSLLMLLPFVKCCLLLQLSMLRSTLQVLLFTCLLPSLPVAVTVVVVVVVGVVVGIAVAIGYVLRHAGTYRAAHTSGSTLKLLGVLEFPLGFFNLLRAMAFAFRCA